MFPKFPSFINVIKEAFLVSKYFISMLSFRFLLIEKVKNGTRNQPCTVIGISDGKRKLPTAAIVTYSKISYGEFPKHIAT